MNNWIAKVTGQPSFDLKNWILDHIVTIIFWAFIIMGLLTAKDLTMDGFFTELCNRFYRNIFLILSLIIPVVAGLGLNFGIVVGAIAGQLAVIAVRYWGISSEMAGGTMFGGLAGFLLMIIIALPIGWLFGWLTGTLYNKTKGQEMIASLIVGYFGNGVYQFIVLFLIGAVIPVAFSHPMILYDGVGIRMSVDMGSVTYALDNILQVPFVPFMIAAAAAILLFLLWNQFIRKPKLEGQSFKLNPLMFTVYTVLCVIVMAVFIFQFATKGVLTRVRNVPVVLMIVVAVLSLFIRWLMNTKLGQDFRSCGMSQSIAEANGINVNRTRVIATIMSTVLAAWGMIIYLQNMGTLNTYTAHNNVGYFSVAAILVGGASVDKATIGQAVTGCLLFHAMFILSPEIGKAVFGQAALGEYFRTFMVYGVIGLSLGLYVWRANKRAKLKDPVPED
jgi:simple sugar transport system permease protein